MNRHGMNARVTIPTADVFTARAMVALINTARARPDGGVELELTPEIFEQVLASMERDGIDPDSEYATVSANEAAGIAGLRAHKN